MKHDGKVEGWEAAIPEGGYTSRARATTRANARVSHHGMSRNGRTPS
jgi:hypothetical protein